MISQEKVSRFTSNDLLQVLKTRPRFVTSMRGKRGPIYSLSDTLVRLPPRIVERQIEKGILVPRDPSGRSFELSAAWRGSAA